MQKPIVLIELIYVWERGVGSHDLKKIPCCKNAAVSQKNRKVSARRHPPISRSTTPTFKDILYTTPGSKENVAENDGMLCFHLSPDFRSMDTGA